MIEAFVVNPEGRKSGKKRASRAKSKGKSMAAKRTKKRGTTRKSNPSRKPAKRAAPRRSNPSKRRRGASRRKATHRRRRRNPDTSKLMGAAKKGALLGVGAVLGAIAAGGVFKLTSDLSVPQWARGLGTTVAGVALAGFAPVQREIAQGAGAMVAAIGIGDTAMGVVGSKPGAGDTVKANAVTVDSKTFMPAVGPVKGINALPMHTDINGDYGGLEFTEALDGLEFDDGIVG